MKETVIVIQIACLNIAAKISEFLFVYNWICQILLCVQIDHYYFF